MARALLLALLAMATGCTLPTRDAAPPSTEGTWIAVASGTMPGVFEDIGRHAWIVGRLPGEAYARWELDPHARRTTTDAPFDYFGRGDITIHRIIHDTPEHIVAIARCLDAEVPAYEKRHPKYFPEPGPDSNTFVAEALKNCHIHVELPATCVGRDYLGELGAAKTESGTGVQVVAYPLALRLGLREGVELHVGAFTVGVHAWPPGISLPVNPGRLGFDDDDGHVPIAARPVHAERPPDFHVPGLLVARAYGEAAAVAHPELAGNLHQLVTSGIQVRGALSNTHPSLGGGLDLAGGVGFPASFMYLARIYPAGMVIPFGNTGYLGVFGGAGISGVTQHVTGGLEVPVEAVLDVEIRERLRLGFRTSLAWVPYIKNRNEHQHVPFGDELTVGAVVRIGRNAYAPAGSWSRGRFFSLERHEVMGSYWLGLGFGTEIALGE